MILHIMKLAVLGSALSVVAYVPVVTTALSTPKLFHVIGDAPGAASEHAPAPPARELTPEEQKFVRSAHERGLFAVGAGHLAFQSSSIREVKLLAAHTLKQRATVDEKLAALAKTKGMASLPEELDASSKETLELMQQMANDEDFELRYCRMVVASYFREIRAFQAQADNASDADLRKLAGEVADDLKQHLAIALVIQRALASAFEGPADTIPASLLLNRRR